MINGIQNNGLFHHKSTLSREGMLQFLHAALESGENRFARQASLAWLAAFPGDMEITLLQAQAVMNEGRYGQVTPVIEQICHKDPFSLDACMVMARACQKTDDRRYRHALTACFVLGGPISADANLENWGAPLRAAWQSINKCQYEEAGSLVQEATRLAPVLLLSEAMNLMVARVTKEASAVYHLAQTYHDRWPDCLPIALVLAESQLKMGYEREAVHLLHQCAANDTTGQTARRLWGDNHPYRSLWPGEDGLHPMVIHFDLPIPAGVAARLGWNQLGPGEVRHYELPVEEAAASEIQEAMCIDDADEDTCTELLIQDLLEDMPDDLADVEEEQTEKEEIVSLEIDPSYVPPAQVEPASQEPEPEAALFTPPVQAERRQSPVKKSEEGLANKVEKEFTRLAKNLKQPDLARADGRYPVYVILSSLEGLTRQYGPQTAHVVDSELRRLSGLMRKRRGWEALVYYPDDAASTAQFELTPVNPRDAWKIKHALVDLDAVLSRRGEMIGALLIVGGDEVIPFHCLPNPTEDADGEVFSDSPYGTRDANYFVPEWPVGRLPGEAGPDAGLLLEQIRDVYRHQSQIAKGKLSLGTEWLLRLRWLLDHLVPTQAKTSFGYTAAVWRRSSLAVFRPIGAPHTVLASPPIASGGFNPRRLAGASLGYYNLHGLEDSPAWYGQRDPLEQGIYPDYPVALSPADLHKNGHAPRFIFSEACYGGHVRGKCESDSLALKFLSMGTLGVVASTSTAYGSINTPLIAADLLGHLFWQHLKAGRTAGEALLRAKVDLVREMNRRQGYLDGEDQKTLISFVLYGDPLATYDGAPLRGKGIYRFKDHPIVHTVSDVETEGAVQEKVSPEILNQVKQVVSEYLPGADLAGMRFCRLQANGHAQDFERVSHGKKNGPGEKGRVVVTVSKQVKFAQVIHRHYLRVTLDENGLAVKMALSR